MSSTSSFILNRLRKEFDSSFEKVPVLRRGGDEAIVIRVSGERFAVRVQDIQALSKLNKLTVVPSAAEGLAGITSIRGDVITVFDLAALLKLGSQSRELRWMVIAQAKEVAVALGFSEVEGYSRIPESSIAREGGGLITRTLKLQNEAIGLIDIPAVVKYICSESEI